MLYNRHKCMLAAAAAVSALTAMPAAAQDPAATSDGEWLSLSGTVSSSSGDMFRLDYGSGSITVEVDDYDWFSENPVIAGDKVVVTGKVDDDFLQRRRIEARSVYVDSLHTTFFANAADEEALLPRPEFYIVPSPGVSLTGTVVDVDGDSLTLDAGSIEYTVHTDGLGYDPFDSTGVQHIDEGDRVTVHGGLAEGSIFERPEIHAARVTELQS